jgi:uncharacterized protein YuzE
MEKIVSYDKENDILTIHKGFVSNEKFQGNIDYGNFVLDLSTKQRIRGIEVFNASTFFHPTRFKQSMFSDVKEADFTARMCEKKIVLTILLKHKEIETPAQVTIPFTLSFQ